MHVPPTQPVEPVHGLPQPPQFALSPLRFTHVLLQATNGVAQLVLHVPPEQTWPDSVQFVEQFPQCVSSLVVSTQVVPQRVSVPQSTRHWPPWQVFGCPGGCGLTQGVLHPPQLLSSRDVSTHTALVDPVGVHGVSPGSHGAPHLPDAHTWEPLQAVVHLPQWS